MLDVREDTAPVVERVRAGELAGTLALAGLLAAAFTLAVGAAGAHRLFFVPSSRHAYPDWLAGPLLGLGAAIEPRTGALLLVAMSGCYLATLATARWLSPRPVWTAVVLAHAAMLLAPPLFSADVFGYVGYARLFVDHGVDPYVHGAAAAPLDPVRAFVAWHDVPTPYGPLFTLASMPIAWVSVPAGLWICKLLAAAGSLLCVGLVARIAAARGHDAVPAVAFLGLNPLLLAYEVGGGHNDVLPVALTLLAVLLVAEQRSAPAGASAGLALAAKASAGLALPFALLGARSRRGALVGAAGAIAAVLAAALVAFGPDIVHVERQLHQQQTLVAHNSFPSRLASLFGHDRPTEAMRAVLSGGSAIALALLLWAVWRRRLDWVAGLGWATLALLTASSWLLPWYLVWLLPLAAVARSRALTAATLAACAWAIAFETWWLLT